MKRLTVVVLAALLALTGCGKKEEGHTAPQPPQIVVKGVKTLELAPSTVPDETQAVGTVRSRRTVSLSTKLMGRITALNVRIGDRVKAGQEIARIESSDLDAQLAKVAAAMKEADEALVELDRAEAAADNGIKAAEAQETLAKTTFDRFKTLADRGSLSRQEFDEAEARYKTAAAETERARETRKTISAKRGQIKARREQAEADGENVRSAQAYAVVTSPIAGIVTGKSAETGMLAAPGMPLAVIEDEDGYRLEAVVDESFLPRLKIGQEVTVAIEAQGDRKASGRIDELVPTADAATRTVTVKIALPSQAGLRPGLFGRAWFAGAEKKLLLVPAGALVERGQLTGVYTVDPQKNAKLTLVKTGASHNGRVEVVSGLSGGETIAVEGVDRMSDGCRLE